MFPHDSADGESGEEPAQNPENGDVGIELQIYPVSVSGKTVGPPHPAGQTSSSALKPDVQPQPPQHSPLLWSARIPPESLASRIHEDYPPDDSHHYSLRVLRR